MFVVDTNVFVYATDQDSHFHDPCRIQLEAWRRKASAWYVTWGILYEYLRITTHPREIPYLSGNVMHNAHTAVLMREHGIRAIYTRDTDFHRFPFLEVVDPAA